MDSRSALTLLDPTAAAPFWGHINRQWSHMCRSPSLPNNEGTSRRAIRNKSSVGRSSDGLAKKPFSQSLLQSGAWRLASAWRFRLGLGLERDFGQRPLLAGGLKRANGSRDSGWSSRCSEPPCLHGNGGDVHREAGGACRSAVYSARASHNQIRAPAHCLTSMFITISLFQFAPGAGGIPGTASRTGRRSRSSIRHIHGAAVQYVRGPGKCQPSRCRPAFPSPDHAEDHRVHGTPPEPCLHMILIKAARVRVSLPANSARSLHSGSGIPVPPGSGCGFRHVRARRC
ncbi:hypothetical protein SKAU_G00113150 [Synaphobranchus kaupii]|uniref:Uncharacterized protein n=1 Tax=Synaphobranchus kaupii TaxID=118154 RepID=A0A9Q1G1I0_SYNKA|nr:hypothetical protein SKAU_G00113150 [Synaphobranchus kaupii]